MGDMKRQNDHLRAPVDFLIQGRTPDDENWRQAAELASFQPFSQEVAAAVIPESLQGFSMPLYGGKTDPAAHLRSFVGRMALNGASDQLKCRLFPMTFKEVAQEWFNSQQEGSISNFTDFSGRFLSQFSASKTQKTTLDSLLLIKQAEGESLRDYVARFGLACIPVEKESPAMCIAIFKHGLRAGAFNDDLNKDPPKSFLELKARTNSFIRVEADDLAKRVRDGLISDP
jgi:hypothetical protein